MPTLDISRPRNVHRFCWLFPWHAPPCQKKKKPFQQKLVLMTLLFPHSCTHRQAKHWNHLLNQIMPGWSNLTSTFDDMTLRNRQRHVQDKFSSFATQTSCFTTFFKTHLAQYTNAPLLLSWQLLKRDKVNKDGPRINYIQVSFLETWNLSSKQSQHWLVLKTWFKVPVHQHSKGNRAISFPSCGHVTLKR